MKVAYHPQVIDFFEQLTPTLYEEQFFGFYQIACDYVDKMIDYISSNIHVRSHYMAPSYFESYGKNMFFITYQPNKQTTWYILFNVNNNRYLIRHITNNHISGHYFNT